ncbi:MAG TPA: MFS transporter [Chloroflexota bacterium]|jgi:CP family cyanate transporter-like MFS transporter
MCLVSLNLRSMSIGVAPVLSLIREDFAISYAQAGVLFALPIAMMGVWAEPGRRLVDRLGPWRAVALSLALIVIGGGLRAVVPDYWPLLLLTGVFGAGIGLAQPSLPRLVAQWFPTRRALATGIYSAGLTGGAVIAASVTAPLLPVMGALSWRGTCLVWAAFACLSLIVWVACGPRGEPNPPGPPSLPGKGGAGSAGDGAAEGAPTPGAAGTEASAGPANTSAPPSFVGKGAGGLGNPPPVWRDKLAWLIALLFLLQSLAFYQLNGWLPSYYQELGLSLGAASVPLAVFNLASLPCNLLASYWSDRVGRRRPFVALAGLLLLAGMAGLLLAPLQPAWLWAALIGGGIGVAFTMALALPTDLLDPRRAGPTVSLMFTVGYTGAIVSPLLAGVLRDALGSFEVAFLPTVATGLGMLVIALALPETARGLNPAH